VKRRSILNLVLAGCIVAVACVDLSAPAGPAAISELLLPSTFVVAGDVMRDSLGNPMPPRIVAFNQHGDSTAVTGASFFFTDSIPHAKLQPDGIIFGDSVGKAHVVAQLGNLQTSVFPLPVTVAPVAIRALASADSDTLFVPVTTDSATSRSKPVPIPLRVSGGTNAPSATLADTAVQGVWVTYKILSKPASRDSVHQPAVFIVNSAGDVSLIDTTNSSGQPVNQIVVIGAFLAPSVLSDTSFASSHVVIQATAFYKPNPGSPGLQHTPIQIAIPLKATFNLK
jgi:hypothetical protein